MTAVDVRFNLLITDDDFGFRETLQGIFEPHGFRTFLAASGEEAIEIIRASTIHLALLDHNLPRMTGIQTLKIIRQFNALMPVIMVTADASTEVRIDAKSFRAFAVLPKPFTRRDVVTSVQDALTASYPGVPPFLR